ncbi:MAG: MYXO-CTERM sorting domain-containing protein [Myxococcales bacterium]|nr:MYXO-CTERM sorting domain-containing protein [Myxococcales bacterium]
MRPLHLLSLLALTTLSARAQAAAPPPTPSFGKSCDPFASYDAQDTCDPTAKPGVVSFKDLILKTYSSTGDYGITRACSSGGTSEHKEGRAWDWKVNYFNTAQRDIADTVIDWLLDTDQHGNACANARRLGMMYFIWNSKIWGAYRSPNASCATAGWKAYTGTNPHTDHVHISWAWTGAKKQTTWWTAALPPEPVNVKPKGYLDGASCERVWGWSQDTDAPAKSIAVHLYFGGPAGDPSAKGVPIDANIDRQDLCTPLGSCKHGFEVASPLSLHDGKPHAVHAYGIDSAGGANAELQQSPATLDCEPVIPSGVRRLVKDMTSFDDWGFSEFWDVMPVADTALAAITEDAALPDNPLLVQSDDGSPEVWVIDGEVRRHVPDPAAFDTWGFDSAAIVKWAAKDLEALPVGPKLRSRPVLVRGSGSEIYLMDDALPKPAPAGSGGSGAGGSGGNSGIDPSGGSGSKTAAGPGQKTKVLSEDAEGGCACRTTGSAPGSSFPALALLGLGLVAARRRRVRA